MSRTKARRDGRREAFWRDAVREQRGSGLSIRAFCRERRLSEASFYSWRRELRRRDEEQPEGETTGRRWTSQRGRRKRRTKPAESSG